MNKEKDPTLPPAPADPRAFYRRIVERNIKRGLINRKDYEKHLKSLPDCAEKVRPTES